MRIKTPYIILLLMFVVLGVYYPALFAPFSSVDDIRKVNSLLNIDHFSLRDIFLPGGSAQYYRPMLGLTFMVDKFLWGIEESFMHLENVLLHMLNVLLVFFIVYRAQTDKHEENKGVALAAALLFAVHPINTEAVIWVSGRTDVLAGFFILLSFSFLLFAFQRSDLRAGAAAALFYLMGCFAKETAVFFLPGALFMIFFMKTRKENSKSETMGNRSRWITGLLFALMPIVYFYFRHIALQRGDRGITNVIAKSTGDLESLWHKIFIMVKVSGFYAKKLFIPVPLNFGIITVPSIYILPGILLLFLALHWFRKRDIVSALLFTALCVGSSALIIAVSQMSWTPIAERYMYMPCAFFSMAVAMVGWRYAILFRLRAVLPGLLVAVLVIFTYVTAARSILWQDNLALAQDTALKSPYFGAAKNDIAVALMSRGKKKEGLKMLDSIDVGSFQAASLNKALVLIDQGKLEDARDYLRKRLNDPVPYRHMILGRLIAVDEMIRDKSTSKEENEKINIEILELLGRLHGITGDPFCYYRMGRVALAVGRKEEAGRYFYQAYQGAPKDSYYRAPAGKLAGKLLGKSLQQVSE